MQGSAGSGKDSWREVLATGGELGGLIEAFDWSTTPLGPMQSWPQSLRTSVSICLSSRFPILLWWGPELVMIYNDAYRPILGTSKHPVALGAPGRQIWPEIWDIIGPMLGGVLAGEGATWSADQLLLLDRHGFVEECYFTFSYSPIMTESDTPVGVFCAVTETTAQVVDARRLRTFGDLAAGLVDVTDTVAAAERAVQALSRNADDVAFVEVHLVDGDALALAAASHYRPEAASWPLEQVRVAGESRLVPRRGQTPPAVVVPVLEPGQTDPSAILVLGLSPRRPYDEGYASFVDLVASHVGNAIAGARSYEAEQRRAQALAELDAAKSTFFSNASHELRTPLTLISAPVDDLLDHPHEPLTHSQRDALLRVQRNTGRLRRLVDTLLEFSRMEAGQLQPRRVATDLAKVTREVAAVMAPAFERAGLDLRVHAPRLPRPVYVDRDMWDRVVLNLLSNAVKYTPRGSVTVSLGDRDGGAELVVADTGVGIAADELPRIFERFHRASSADGRSQEGAGIGLALVHDLLGLHDGSVQVDSSLGEGSVFTVRIPYGTGANATGSSITPVADAFVTEARGWTDPAPPPPHAATGASKARVLLAEDNADLRNYLVDLLSGLWDVQATPDGQAALDAARRHPPDLVLADVMMPRLDGFELLRELRADATTAAVPVMLLSARAGEESTVAGLTAGADDYLVKPFSSTELLARVRAHLSGARDRRAEASWRSAVVNALHEGVFLADPTGVVFEVNDAWTHIVGYGPEDLPYGPPYPWWPDPHEDAEDRALLDAALVHLLDEGAGAYDVPFRHRDGSRVWVSMQVATVPDPSGTGSVFVGTIRDITYERTAQARMRGSAELSAQLAAADNTEAVVAATVRGLTLLFGGTAYVLPPATDALYGVHGRLAPSEQPEAVRAPAPLAPADGDRVSTGLTTRRRMRSGDVHGGMHGDMRGDMRGNTDTLTVWVQFDRPRRVSVEEQILLETTTDLVAEAFARAHEADVARHVAQTLQRTLMGPGELPVTVAARYTPLEPHLEVGGDWYDYLRLHDGRVGLVVGDCVGRGLAAAAVMGQLRSACRALLLHTASPADALTGLDHFASQIPAAVCTTVFCAVADLHAQTLTYSRAGHPPALLLAPDAAVQWLNAPTGLPLAVVPDDERTETTVPLRPGTSLLLYTDGLIERRGEDLDLGCDRLARAAATHARLAPASMLDRVLGLLAPPDGAEDDVAALLMRTSPLGRESMQT